MEPVSLPDLLGTCGLAVLFALLLWVPGWCLTRAAGVRGWSALALAPGLTVALVAVATTVAQALGWRWGTAALPLLGVLTAVLTGLVVVLSRVPGSTASRLGGWRKTGGWLRGRNRPGDLARSHGPVLLAVLLTAVAWTTAYGWGAVSPRWPAQAFDAVFHLSAVAAVREGGDASLLGGLEALYQGQSVYYPTPWHAMVSLLPAGPVQATNAALLGTGALVWPSALAGMLTGVRDLLPGPGPVREWGVALTVLLGGTAIAFTMLLTSLAVWPYALSVVALPGVLLALHLLVPTRVLPVSPSVPGQDPGTQGSGPGLDRGPQCRSGPGVLPLVLLLVMCTVGAAAAHGVAVFSVMVLGAGWLPAVWRVATAGVRARVRATAVVVVAALGGLWAVRRPLGSVLGYSRPDGGWEGLVATLGQALADLPAYGTVWGWTSLLGLVTASLTLLGAWLAWRQPAARSWLRAWVAALLLTVMVGGPSWWGRQLGAPWYLQKARLVPLVLLPALVLAALACSHLLARVRTSRQRRFGGRDSGRLLARDGGRPGGRPGRPGGRRGSRRVLPGVAAAVLVVVLAGGRLPLQRDLVASVHDPEQVQYGTLVTAREIDFIQGASSLLPPDAVVVGPPSRGASMLWSLGGVHVVYPSRSRPSAHSAEHQLADAWPGLKKGTGSQEVCRLLRELGAFYLYTDYSRDAEGARHGQPPYRWDVGFAQVPLEDIELVASDGDYALWRITACD
ncbi:hypothetical protein D5R93_10030 [Actinomyces lilanjuaniae]|uniref:Uncharacterized protein n=1 Tax=Actinomyces lilanjuaniae TaxID=2321394 RepID=A0ABN5PTL5_9ACTO|nr:hypothetical protein D5R93_10030 [Actinomyces lilanjuaniae]